MNGGERIYVTTQESFTRKTLVSCRRLSETTKTKICLLKNEMSSEVFRSWERFFKEKSTKPYMNIFVRFFSKNLMETLVLSALRIENKWGVENSIIKWEIFEVSLKGVLWTLVWLKQKRFPVSLCFTFPNQFFEKDFFVAQIDPFSLSTNEDFSFIFSIHRII